MTTYLLPATTVAVTGPRAAEVDALLADLPRRDDATAEHQVVAGADVTLDGEVVVDGAPSPELVAPLAVWAIDGLVRTSDPHVVLHASAVARGGEAVVLAGSSGAGKSTLAAAGVLAGWTYLGDEYTLLEPTTGRLVPYCRPIGLDAGAKAHLGLVDAATDAPVPASALRAAAPGGEGDVVPAVVVLPRVGLAAEPAEVAPLDALVALVTHATAIDADRFLLLAGLVAACPTWTLGFADAPSAVAVLGTLLDAAPAGAPVVAADPGRPFAPGTTTTWFGDAAVVLHEPSGRLHVLNEAAAAVWADVADTPPPPELGRQLVELGLLPPPNANRV